MKYLLGTNIIAFFLRGKPNLGTKIRAIGTQNCFISEITVAELKFGTEHSSDSEQRQRNLAKVEGLLAFAQVLPIAPAFDIYAKEKSRLRKLGTPTDDFDLLIGANAIAHDLVMVNNNLMHIGRLEGIAIEDWTQN